MSQTILEAKTRYSTKSSPEERAKAKLNFAANLNDDDSEEEEEEESTVQTNSAVKEPASSQGATVGKCKKRKKSKGNSMAANKTHTEMCDKAMKMIGRIDKFLDKFESGDKTD